MAFGFLFGLVILGNLYFCSSSVPSSSGDMITVWLDDNANQIEERILLSKYFQCERGSGFFSLSTRYLTSILSGFFFSDDVEDDEISPLSNSKVFMQAGLSSQLADMFCSACFSIGDRTNQISCMRRFCLRAISWQTETYVEVVAIVIAYNCTHHTINILYLMFIHVRGVIKFT